jgi:hypothetical protein
MLRPIKRPVSLKRPITPIITPATTPVAIPINFSKANLAHIQNVNITGNIGEATRITTPSSNVSTISRASSPVNTSYKIETNIPNNNYLKSSKSSVGTARTISVGNFNNNNTWNFLNNNTLSNNTKKSRRSKTRRGKTRRNRRA